MHQQVPIKVNTTANEPIAKVVETLNFVYNNITILYSCEDRYENWGKKAPKGIAYIAFKHISSKSWVDLGALCYKLWEKLILLEVPCINIKINWSVPEIEIYGELEFSQEYSSKIVEALLA